MEILGDETGLLNDRHNLNDILEFYERKQLLIEDGYAEAGSDIQPDPIKIQETTPERYKLAVKRKVARIMREVPLDFQQNDVRGALDSLVQDYLAVDLDSYSKLDNSLFGLERVIKSDKIEGILKDQGIIIPLFADVKLGNSEWKTQDVRIKGGGRREYEAKISSRAPPITWEAKKEAKEFTKQYLEVVSKALDDELMGELVFRQMETGPNFKIYWIPNPSELKIDIKVKDKDPFLVAHNFGKNFLVAQWDVEGELPYQHYLAEFKE